MNPEVRATKKFFEVRQGSATAKVYKRPQRWGKYKSFAIVCRSAAGLIRAKRSDLAKAKKRAEDIAREVSNGTFELTIEDRAELQAARKNIIPTGKSLALATADYAQIVCKLDGVPFDEVLQFYRDHRPRNPNPLPVPKLVTELLTAKKTEVGARWHRTLGQQLGSFAEHFTGPLHSVQARDINAWLRKLEVSARSRHNYRVAVEVLVGWARSCGQLSRAWDELERVPDPGAAMTSEIRIFTPEQLNKLLAARLKIEEGKYARKNSLIPFLVIAAFAGVRHEEMDGEKALLDWRDVHLDGKEPYIYVPKGVAKTGRDRIVPIHANLVEWLTPYARRNGKICEINCSAALCKAKALAALPTGTRNALRKSFISYRLAETKNIAQVAEESGNSPAVIRTNYKRPIPEAEALRWFSISPSHAEVLQLRFF